MHYTQHPKYGSGHRGSHKAGIVIIQRATSSRQHVTVRVGSDGLDACWNGDGNRFSGNGNVCVCCPQNPNAFRANEVDIAGSCGSRVPGNDGGFRDCGYCCHCGACCCYSVPEENGESKI